MANSFMEIENERKVKIQYNSVLNMSTPNTSTNTMKRPPTNMSTTVNMTTIRPSEQSSTNRVNNFQNNLNEPSTTWEANEE